MSLISFGYERQPAILLNDTALLNATLYGSDEQTLIPVADIEGISFTILKPNDNPNAPSIAEEAGEIVGDGHAQFVVPSATNDIPGSYKGLATFIYAEGTNTGLVKSIPVDYTVTDPFVRTGPSPADAAVRQTWMMLEDCFDSEQGGPWLRDMTMAVFDQSKLLGLVPQVIMDINLQMPFSNWSETNFPYTAGDGEALVAQGLLVATCRHLMRAYTEQPDMVSSPVAFMDRKRYQQAWKAVYDVEGEKWKLWLTRWKFQSYDLTHASLLLGSKAGRMLPAPMRSRNVGRGF